MSIKGGFELIEIQLIWIKRTYLFAKPELSRTELGFLLTFIKFFFKIILVIELLFLKFFSDIIEISNFGQNRIMVKTD